MPPVSTTRRIAADRSGRDVFVLLSLDDAFFDERIPLMALRTLPQQLCTPIAASHAHMRVEVEDGFACKSHVPSYEVLIKIERGERLPDDLVDC